MKAGIGRCLGCCRVEVVDVANGCGLKGPPVRDIRQDAVRQAGQEDQGRTVRVLVQIQGRVGAGGQDRSISETVHVVSRNGQIVGLSGHDSGGPGSAIDQHLLDVVEVVVGDGHPLGVVPQRNCGTGHAVNLVAIDQDVGRRVDGIRIAPAQDAVGQRRAVARIGQGHSADVVVQDGHIGRAGVDRDSRVRARIPDNVKVADGHTIHIGSDGDSDTEAGDIKRASISIDENGVVDGDALRVGLSCGKGDAAAGRRGINEVL